MTRRPESISDVVACSLCTGCGACAGAFPEFIQMVDDTVNGRRPVVQPDSQADRDALTVCAGLGSTYPKPRDKVEADWGPVLECWEGYAADPEIRFRGSSGGAVTALATFALERGDVDGVAHIAARTDDPRLNKTVISRTPGELTRAAGSRYAQASPVESIAPIRAGEDRVAMIGKPCDIASLTTARASDPVLAAKTPLTIAIFCAGAPTLSATDALLDRLNVPANARVTDLRYRGMGWPGLMQATWVDADGVSHKSEAIPYAEGWGRILQQSRRWRCRVCDDHTGAFADISVGDPWHNPPEGEIDAQGRSLIVARTAAGQALIDDAIAAGVLIASPRPRDVIARAQPNLVATNAAVWGRRLAMRLFGLPVPIASRASSLAAWSRLPLRAKAQSIFGTLRRIVRDGITRPVQVTPHTEVTGA